MNYTQTEHENVLCTRITTSLLSAEHDANNARVRSPRSLSNTRCGAKDRPVTGKS